MPDGSALNLAAAEANEDTTMPFKSDEIYHDHEMDKEAKDKFNSFAKETMLELVEADDGRLMLRDMEGEEDALVTIGF